MEKVRNFFNKNQKIFNILKAALPYLFPILAFINLAVFLSGGTDNLINSDHSSELVLGKLLSEEGGLLSTNWFYSTEVRVLNTQIVYKTLFHFTNNWHLVRYLGCLINALILSLSGGYITFTMGLKKFIPFVMGILLLPISYQYFDIVLFGSYYVPHIAITFVFLGFMFSLLKARKLYAKIIYIVLACLLAFVSCLGGLRQLCILFAPMMMAVALMLFIKHKELKGLKLKELITNPYVIFTGAAILTSLFGVWGYHISETEFRKYFAFHNFNYIYFTEFNWDRILETIKGFFNFYGYQHGDKVFSGQTLVNVATFLLMGFGIYSIYKVLKNHKDFTISQVFISLFTAMGFAVMFIMYGFTDFEYTHRYLIPAAVMVYISYANLLGGIKWKCSLKSIIAILLVVFMILPSNLTYAERGSTKGNNAIKQMAQIILNKGCTEGYATFWNANIMTEITDGKLKVRTWNTNAPIDVLDNYHRWLHVKDFGKKDAEGKVFLLFTTDEYNQSRLKDSLDMKGKVLNTTQYVLFVYDDYSDIYK
ncbi:MAG: hypothetical protein E7564_01910 [Ruminococcaceae bacterium]|nr:hypothetical protein [Oscillospiraceae bacterium]